MRWKRIAAAATVAAAALAGAVGTASALPTATRLAGADRYETAVEVSKANFSAGVDVVFIARGDDYPDALAAGPVGAKLGGPVLLVAPGTIPSKVIVELQRLQPKRIVVLGGDNAVSPAVETALDPFTTGPVDRIEGPDRYSTAAALSAATFSPGVPVAYVALGTNYPDALAGGAAAGSEGGPVLLVTKTSIPSTVATELDRLNPAKIVVLGGTDAVAESVSSLLNAYSETVVRRSGADRFATSVEISKGAFTTASTVYLATGENFPDALAAGPPAGIDDGPILLVRKTCIPASVNAEVTRLGATSVVILGGTAAVSTAVAEGTLCTA